MSEILLCDIGYLISHFCGLMGSAAMSRSVNIAMELMRPPSQHLGDRSAWQGVAARAMYGIAPQGFRP